MALAKFVFQIRSPSLLHLFPVLFVLRVDNYCSIFFVDHEVGN